MITIGSLSRSRYWGESAERPLRPALCTCTLITGQGFRLLVDRSLADGEQMARELYRRGYVNSVDLEPASRTIAEIAGTAHIVVPGHDNHFLAGARRACQLGGAE